MSDCLQEQSDLCLHYLPMPFCQTIKEIVEHSPYSHLTGRGYLAALIFFFKLEFRLYTVIAFSPLTKHSLKLSKACLSDTNLMILMCLV